MKKYIYILFLSCISLCAFAAPRTISREAAEELGKLAVEYNGRICPVQTMANEFCLKLCGKKTYKGLSAEQVLAGWLFFYDDWAKEPMIKVKGEAYAVLNPTSRKDAKPQSNAKKGAICLNDYVSNGQYKLAGMKGKDLVEADEKFQIISNIATGKAMRIYGRYSWADDLPKDMSVGQVQFIRGSSGALYMLAETNDERLVAAIQKIAQYQQDNYTFDTTKLKAERIYNRYDYTLPLCLICSIVGFVLLMLHLCNWSPNKIQHEKTRRIVSHLMNTTLIVLICHVVGFLTLGLGLRWYISDHIPMTNGYETMQFMAWVLSLLALIASFRFLRQHRQPTTFTAIALLATGLVLAVSLMSSHNPQITTLQPALQHPLLAYHVSVIMMSYALFFIILLQSIISLVKPSNARVGALLPIAVILLTIGIVLGSIWAKTAWGSYWSWDPKETCALITLIVYTIPLFKRWLPFFHNEKVYYWYLVLAFASVLFTYFGANYLLPGLHSYAG